MTQFLRLLIRRQSPRSLSRWTIGFKWHCADYGPPQARRATKTVEFMESVPVPGKQVRGFYRICKAQSGPVPN